eukprot:2758071-Pleurochrysis_carterae.AAC.2
MAHQVIGRRIYSLATNSMGAGRGRCVGGARASEGKPAHHHARRDLEALLARHELHVWVIDNLGHGLEHGEDNAVYLPDGGRAVELCERCERTLALNKNTASRARSAVQTPVPAAAMPKRDY